MPTYYVSTTGNNLAAGTSEVTAWRDINYAADNIANGDIVYVKADGTYNEEVSLNVVGITTAWVQFIGYSSAIGDNGIVTINGSTYGFTTQASSSNYYVVLANFKVTSTTSHGYNLTSKDNMMFYNCQTDTTVAGRGFSVGEYSTLVLCIADGCTNEGFFTGQGSCLIYCKSRNNGDDQILLDGDSAVIDSMIYGITNASLEAGVNMSLSIGWSAAISNTFDGEGGNASRGMRLTNYGTVISNNIFYDCQVGIDTPSSWNNNLYVGTYNAFVSTPTKYDTIPDTDSDWDTSNQVDEPSNSDPFTNSPSDIYVLDATNGANLINAAYDVINEGGTGDIGAAQGGRAVGGGAGIMYHVGMDGGMKG